MKAHHIALQVLGAILSISALAGMPSLAADPDATALRSLTDYLHGKIKLSADAAANADLDGDGETDIYDLALLKRSIRLEAVTSGELTPVIRTDVTREVDPLLWNNVCLPADSFAAVQTMLIDSPETLEHQTGALHEAVQRSLLRTYDAAFFEDNVLVLHYGLQEDARRITEIADISYRNDTLTVTAEQQESEERQPTGIALWQIALPRSQYNGNGVEWVEKDTAYLNAGYHDYDLWELCGAMGFSLQDDYMNTLGGEGIAVRDSAALQELGAKLFDEQGAAWLEKQFPDSFFEKQAVWFGFTNEISYSVHSLWQTRQVGDTVFADIRVKTGSGDIGSVYLHTLTFDKNIDAAQFRLRQVAVPSFPGVEGKISYFDVGHDSSLLVNTYSFGDEHEITLYWTHPIGMEQYAARERIASFEVAEDCSDFSQPYEVLSIVREETMLDDAEVWENAQEGYSLILGTDGVTVCFLKSKATGEEERITLPYPS